MKPPLRSKTKIFQRLALRSPCLWWGRPLASTQLEQGEQLCLGCIFHLFRCQRCIFHLFWCQRCIFHLFWCQGCIFHLFWCQGYTMYTPAIQLCLPGQTKPHHVRFPNHNFNETFQHCWWRCKGTKDQNKELDLRHLLRGSRHLRAHHCHCPLWTD